MNRKGNALTVYYIVIVGLILGLAITTHLLIVRVTAEQEGAASVINVAGRQRMLSQRITLFSSEYLRTGMPADRQQLMSAIDLMSTQHAMLTASEPGSSFHARLSPPLKKLYFEDGLAPQVDDFINTALSIADNTAVSAESAHEHLMQMATSEMLEQLDLGVKLYQLDSEHAIERLRKVQFVTSFILLLSVLAEVVLIFRPLFRWSRRMHQLAMTDELTGLSNRRAFMQSATEAVNSMTRNGPQLAFLALDIDNFKRINDTYGHDCGDKVLSTLAARMRSQSRKVDTIGRIGGEEFCVMFPCDSQREAQQTGKRLLARISESRLKIDKDLTLDLTLSGGLTLLRPEESVCDVMKRADELLYAAKSSGKAQIKDDFDETYLLTA